MDRPEYFLMYKEWRNAISLMTSEQKGSLLDAIYAYQCSGVYRIEDNMVKVAFEGFILPTFKKNEDKYKETCRIKSENGKKGGRPKNKSNDKDNLLQLFPNIEKAIDNKENADKSNVKGTKKGNVIYAQFDFSIAAPEHVPLLIKWLNYKRSRRETYKTQNSFKQLYKRMKQIGSVDEINDAIEYSMANNYAGLFRDKNKYTNENYIQRREFEQKQRRDNAANIMQELFDERDTVSH